MARQTRIPKAIRKYSLTSTTMIATLALVIAVFAAFYAMAVYYQVSIFTNSDASTISSISNLQSRYEFCYDNAIHPCSDAAIQHFNQQPANVKSGNTFNL